MSVAIEGKPVGRRVVLGMLGLGSVGVLVGGRVQDAIASVFANDPTGITSLLPTGGRFRIYSVVGYLPSRKTTEYKLEISGLVDRPVTLTYDDLVALPPTMMTKDFQCVTGWRVQDVKWVGVRLSDLLDAAGVQSSGKAVTFHSFDGSYTESLTMDQARRPDVIVAYSMEGKAIPARHGGPVRLYVAPMYGYKSLKWLDQIEVVDAVQPGYWEVRGYDVDAWIGRSNGRDDQPV
jgi:DMSO/TMAO reductase YedYZ molybdopterin-dependent catalytic subunit